MSQAFSLIKNAMSAQRRPLPDFSYQVQRGVLVIFIRDESPVEARATDILAHIYKGDPRLAVFDTICRDVNEHYDEFVLIDNQFVGIVPLMARDVHDAINEIRTVQ